MFSNKEHRIEYKIVSLGRMQRPKGLHGQLRVTTRGEILSQRKKNDVLTLYRANGILDGFLTSAQEYKQLTLEKIVSVFSNYLVLNFQEIQDIAEAENLQGFYIGLNIENPPAWFVPKEELYLFEYMGLQVQDQYGKEYGKVVRLEDNASSPLLIIEVAKKDGVQQEVMIPLNAPYVQTPLRSNQGILIIEDFSIFTDV